MVNKTKQNVWTVKSSKISEALGGFEPTISCLRNRRIEHYATEPCYTEKYQEVHCLIVMVKKPKEPMTIKSMENVSTAKSSKISEALNGFEPPISQLQDRRRNHYATEACYTEMYQEGHPLIHL